MPCNWPTSRNDSVAEAACWAPMAVTLGALIDETAAAISLPDVEDPGQEARTIIAQLLDAPRWWPAAHRADPATPTLVIAVRSAATRRRRGMPLAYAVGRAAFRHLELAVDERVLIPRPETEVLVDRVLERVRGGIAVDVGTGSGAIALALASEGDFSLVVGTDLSLDALAVARANSLRLSIPERRRLEFRDGSYLAPVRDLRVRTVVANPPYISFTEAGTLPRSVRSWSRPPRCSRLMMGLPRRPPSCGNRRRFSRSADC